MEWARFDLPEGADLVAVEIAVDAPEGGITAEWRQETGDALVRDWPTATAWETLDESDDRDISEFVLDLKVG